MLARAPSPFPLPPVAATVVVWACLSGWLIAEGSWVALPSQLALALAVWRLLQALAAPHPARAAALVLLLPTVLLDVGRDVLWVAVCVIALTAAIRRRHGPMLGWFGLALGLSMQALALAPLLVALLIQRRVSWRLCAIGPTVAGAVLLAGGWPAGPIAEPPNLWALARALPWIGDLPLTGLALAATIGAGAAFGAWFAVRPLHGRAVIAAGLLCALVMAGLAPGIGFCLAGILAFALASRERAEVRIALLVQAGWVLALLPGGAALGAIPLLLATALLARAVLSPAANDNPLMARTIKRTT